MSKKAKTGKICKTHIQATPWYDMSGLVLMKAKRGNIWIFYPIIEQQFNVRYEPNDFYYLSGDQWHLNNSGQNNGSSGVDVNVRNVWNDYSGSGVVVGVIDDGIDYNNPDLAPNFLSEYSFDYCGNDSNVIRSNDYSVLRRREEY